MYILSFFLLGFLHLATAQTFQGTVGDAKYGTGIPGVLVSVGGASDTAITDENGAFTLENVSIPVADPGRKGASEFYWNPRVKSFSWETGRSVNFAVWDMAGQKIKSRSFSKSSNSRSFSLGNTGSGIFFVKISTPDQSYTSRIVLMDAPHSPSHSDINGYRSGIITLNKPGAPLPAATLHFSKTGWLDKRVSVEGSQNNMDVRLIRKKIKVLIIDGFSNHDWQRTTTVIKAIFNQSGFFDFTVTSSPPSPANSPDYNNWSFDLDSVEAILMNVNNINTNIDWPASIKSRIETYMQNGGGMFVLHGSNNAFSNWDEYSKMIGYGWRDGNFGPAYRIENDQVVEVPAGGMGTNHGSRFNALMNTLSDHPINKGYPDQWMTTDAEVYTTARAFPGNINNMTFLSYAYDETNGTNANWPMEVVVSYGEGRVYNGTMGHLWGNDPIYPDRMADVGFQTTLIRGLEWVAREEVILPVPDNFPTATQLSHNRDLIFPDLPDNFNSEVERVFTQNQCIDCHSPGAVGWSATGGQSGGLDLSTLNAAYNTTVNVPSYSAPDQEPGFRIIPGDPDASFLMQKIDTDTPKSGNRMPPGLTMSNADIQVIRDWIANGVPVE